MRVYATCVYVHVVCVCVRVCVRACVCVCMRACVRVNVGGKELKKFHRQKRPQRINTTRYL